MDNGMTTDNGIFIVIAVLALVYVPSLMFQAGVRQARDETWEARLVIAVV